MAPDPFAGSQTPEQFYADRDKLTSDTAKEFGHTLGMKIASGDAGYDPKTGGPLYGTMPSPALPVLSKLDKSPLAAPAVAVAATSAAAGIHKYSEDHPELHPTTQHYLAMAEEAAKDIAVIAAIAATRRGVRAILPKMTQTEASAAGVN